MNLTEIARRLKVPTKELREWLPKLGFDVGAKAIKVESKLAQEILQTYKKKLSEHHKKEAYYKQKEEQAKAGIDIEEKGEVQFPAIVTVKEFAAILNMSVTDVIAVLMKNGIFASLNERIDFETASIIAQDLGYTVKEEASDNGSASEEEGKLETLLQAHKESGQKRPPVVVIMGHVDHGKTKLLDTIRKANVVAGESGGITQHIGAYQVEKKGRKISFIDTPGHEAFTAMRSRGAKVADIAILIVAADDGVKPQTVEALRIIQKSEIPMIVAINKIDKEDANQDKVKNELAQYNITPEEWGGSTLMAPISALKGDGIDELLDMILLTADVHEADIKAEPDHNAVGTIIESHVDKAEGIVATILVQTGTLRKGDKVAVDDVLYGSIRSMRNHLGEEVTEAAPSTPVKVIGLKVQPKVGDVAAVPENVKDLKKGIKKYRLEKGTQSNILVQKSQQEVEKGKRMFNLVIKADVLGSLEAIIESLEKIESDHIKANIISRGLGHVTENDIRMAKAGEAMLVGFHVKTLPQIEQLAQEHGIGIDTYEVIYDLIEDVKDRMEKTLGEEILQRELGKMRVLAIFKTEKNAMILGGKVTEGMLEFKPNNVTKIHVLRGEEYITDGILDQLQVGKESVAVVDTNQECGIRFIGNPVVQIDDTLEVYVEEKKKKVL